MNRHDQQTIGTNNNHYDHRIVLDNYNYNYSYASKYRWQITHYFHFLHFLLFLLFYIFYVYFQYNYEFISNIKLFISQVGLYLTTLLSKHLFVGCFSIQIRSSILRASIFILAILLLSPACSSAISTSFFLSLKNSHTANHLVAPLSDSPALDSAWLVISPYALQHLSSWTHAITVPPSSAQRKLIFDIHHLSNWCQIWITPLNLMFSNWRFLI